MKAGVLQSNKSSILSSKDFDDQLKELREIAKRIREYEKREERLRWEQQMSLENG